MTTINLTPWGTTIQLSFSFKVAQRETVRLSQSRGAWETEFGTRSSWMGRSWSDLCWSPSLGDGPGGQKFDHRHWGPAFPHSYENSSWKLCLLVEVRHSQVLGGTHTGESKPPGVAMGSLHTA